MPRLILINGAPGTGKSTLARRYASVHPLTLALDIDVVRGLLGAWLDQPSDAGRLARRIALAMARVVLGEGHDVVVPQYLGRVGLVLELAELAEAVGVEFVEIALVNEVSDIVARFAERMRSPENREHQEAAVLLERSGGLAALPDLSRRLHEVIAVRPDTRTMSTTWGDVDGSFTVLRQQIEGGNRSADG